MVGKKEYTDVKWFSGVYLFDAILFFCWYTIDVLSHSLDADHLFLCLCEWRDNTRQQVGHR